MQAGDVCRWTQCWVLQRDFCLCVNYCNCKFS